MTNFKSIWSIPLLTVCALTLSACSDDETKGESDEIQKVENTGLIEAVTGKVPGIGLTTNEDGTVPLTEDNLRKMAAVTELDLSECELTDLSGIEYFTGLVTLDCSGNKLTSLDFSASSADLAERRRTDGTGRFGLRTEPPDIVHRRRPVQTEPTGLCGQPADFRQREQPARTGEPEAGI